MSRKVLEEIYFKIGATSKTGSTQIGGMGRARILTCFSMRAYSIRSDDYEVIGQGGEYDVHDRLPVTGCALVIEAVDTTAERMTRTLNEFLSESRIDARIFVNDLPTTVRADKNGHHARDLLAGNETFARVYINKKVESQRVIVRVNGVSMFSISTTAPAQIIVELEPSLSRQALTANRDGLRGICRDALDDFLRELAVDTISSLRKNFKPRTTVAPGGGLLSIRSKPKKIEPIEPGTVIEMYTPRQPKPVTSRLTHEGDGAYDEKPVEYDAFGVWLTRTFGDIFIFDETENTAVHKVVPQYLPENWKPMTISGKTFRKGGNITKVLLMWRTAILYALEVSLDLLNAETLNYGLGFVFVDDRKAEHRNENNGHLFLLNPVNKDGKLSYGVKDRRSLKRLMQLAKHEVAHVSTSWHSEQFSSIREQIDVEFDEAECFRRMKDALNAVPDFEVNTLRRAA